MDFFTSKWGEGSNHQIFQEEPEVEGPSSVCDYLLQKGPCRELSVGPQVYDSYSSKTKDSIVDFQEGWLFDTWVAKDQQQAFLKNSKAKELNSICGCPDQEGISQQTFHGNNADSTLR